MGQKLETRPTQPKGGAVALSEDHYLSEMTERLEKLRSLMGEQKNRGGKAN